MLDFLCIGAQKAGTSWLHRQLERHPDVLFPHGKEVHYWDWVQRGKMAPNIDWYRERFTDVPGRRLGDMTPDYAVLEPALIEQIGQHFPGVRILFVLRHPVERAWSAARMAMDYAGLTTQEIDEAWLARICRSRESLARGDYATTLKRWRAVFPAEAIRVLFYEDLKREPRGFLLDVARHIGLDPHPIERFSAGQLSIRVREGASYPISDALYAELLERYRPFVIALQQELCTDLSRWLQPRGTT